MFHTELPWWLRKSRSTSGFAGPWTDDWVLWIFVISLLHTFSGSSIFHSFTRSYPVWMTSKIQVNFRFCRSLYWWLGLMDFRNFFTYVFGVKESIFHSFTELPFLDDFENPGQLPVLQVLEGTDDWVLWIFVISLLHTFSGSPCFTKLPFLMTSKIQVNWFCRSLRVLMILWIFVISSLPTFSGSRNPFFIVSRSSQLKSRSCLDDFENTRSTSENPGFAGPWGYCWLSLMDFRNFFIIYVFGVKESIFL